ncbi:MAG: hypothetical protein HDS11_04055 [Bacteroides sp.]|nr:hypothetical protein [Bacteroides sp.]
MKSLSEFELKKFRELYTLAKLKKDYRELKKEFYKNSYFDVPVFSKSGFRKEHYKD